jgi:Nuclease subunit of the excinuclease complex
MNKCSMNFDFEEAAVYRDKIINLQEILEKQKIDVSTENINQDIIAMAFNDEEACVQSFFIRHGKIVGREAFYIRRYKGFYKGIYTWFFCKTILYECRIYTKGNYYRM